MTEIYVPSFWTRLGWKLPRILKMTVHPGRPAYISSEVWAKHPLPSYPEWVIAWGGRWRWRVRRDHIEEARRR